jgi:hypothetical protein
MDFSDEMLGRVANLHQISVMAEEGWRPLVPVADQCPAAVRPQLVKANSIRSPTADHAPKLAVAGCPVALRPGVRSTVEASTMALWESQSIQAPRRGREGSGCVLAAMGPEAPVALSAARGAARRHRVMPTTIEHQAEEPHETYPTSGISPIMRARSEESVTISVRSVDHVTQTFAQHRHNVLPSTGIFFKKRQQVMTINYC